MGSVQLVGKKHIGPKFKSQRILINLFSMYFTKVLQFTPLVTSAFGYRLSDLGTSEVVFHKSPPRTLRGFEDFADNIAASEIRCKLNNQVTACSNLESTNGHNVGQYTKLFGGWGKAAHTASIEFLFDKSYGVEFQFSRGFGWRSGKDHCTVELLLNDEVISAVPKGVIHMNANDLQSSPVPTARLAVRAGDALSLRETGTCIFVLKSLKTWLLDEGYDSSKEIQYMDLRVRRLRRPALMKPIPWHMPRMGYWIPFFTPPRILVNAVGSKSLYRILFQVTMSLDFEYIIDQLICTVWSIQTYILWMRKLVKKVIVE